MEATATGHWRKALSRLDADELFELRDQVADVTARPGWQRILDLIDEGYMAVFRDLTQRGTRDHETYAHQTGYVAGLEEAVNVVQAITDAASTREQRLKRGAVADQRTRQEASV